MTMMTMMMTMMTTTDCFTLRPEAESWFTCSTKSVVNI